MPTLRLAGLPAALALLVAPVTARAQSCDELRRQMFVNGTDIARIAIDFPRTHIAILTCFAGNERERDAQACAAAMVVAACLGMGSDDCNELTSRWQRAAETYAAITARMRALGCRQ